MAGLQSRSKREGHVNIRRWRIPMRTLALILILALAACSPAPIGGDWRLDNEDSHLGFVSVKSGAIAEAHRFGTLSGSVRETGEARIAISLDSVETNIDIRNERMREHLFETNLHPEAIITAQIDLAHFDAMPIGARQADLVDLALNLHGVEATIHADLIITRLGENRVLVETSTPIILHAEDFGLQAGLDVLQGLAGLPGITPVVPVTFAVVFER
jgi:polyisoprenoid-binding protein YceI